LPPTIRTPHLQDPIRSHLRADWTSFSENLTVDEVLQKLRHEGVGERVVYFYVTNEEGRLVGVVPTRRLLTSTGEKQLSDLMVRNLVMIPDTATVLDACEFFVMHKFLAFPVVDSDKRMIGIVDVQMFTDEVFDLAERERADAAFEALGFSVSQVRDAHPLRAFRFRFPWLIVTIVSGTASALLASLFVKTLTGSIVLAFFMTLVLGLGESVASQSITVTIQALRSVAPSRRWFLHALAREFATAMLLGLACGSCVVGIVIAWRGEIAPALVIGTGVFLSLIAASLFGLCVPALLHSLKLDPQIAAGPVSLACSDLCTVTVYLTLAAMALG
jgi:magnesium transporter